MTILDKPQSKPLASPTEDKILELLKEHSSAMSVDEIFTELHSRNRLSERIVKEAILKLRQEGKIIPDNQWKIQISK